MADVASSDSALPRRSVPLGLFIVGQLVFLFAHNLLGRVQELREEVREDLKPAIAEIAPGWLEGKGYVWGALDETTQLTHRWAQVTLQLQTWSLFAPDIGRECIFPALLIDDNMFQDGPFQPKNALGDYPLPGKLILSDNEPPDMMRFLRVGKFRLRRFENNLVVYLVPWDNQTPAENAERWRGKIREHVGRYSEMLQGYVRFRLEETKQTPPRQVVLVMRRFHLAGTERGEDFVEGPFTVPVLRWRLADGNDRRAFDVFNPVTHRFELLEP